MESTRTTASSSLESFLANKIYLFYYRYYRLRRAVKMDSFATNILLLFYREDLEKQVLQGFGESGGKRAASSSGHISPDLDKQTPQAPGTIRVLVTESYGDEDFARQLAAKAQWKRHRLHWEAFRKFERPGNPWNSGYRALASQWQSVKPEQSCCILGYEYLTVTTGNLHPGTSDGFKSFLLRWTEVARQQESPKWAQTDRCILFREYGGEKRVFIDCRSWVSKRINMDFVDCPEEYPLTPTEKFVAELKQLEDTYLPIRSADNWRKAILLQCHHASLHILADFVQDLSSTYVSDWKREYDTQQSKLRKWYLNRMAIDAELYRSLLDNCASITKSVDTLLEILSLTDDTAPNPSHLHLPVLATTLRSSRDLNAHLTKLSSDLSHRLHILEMRRTMRQTDNVERLTLLATVFLPMSLAAGILSMQSRFRDLGALLYDFVGVVVLLGYGAAIVLAVMLLLSFAKELDSRLMWYPFYRDVVRRVLRGGWVVTAVSFAALLLASFVLGMFKDVDLGARVLGYGTLAVVFGPVAGMVIGVILLDGLAGWVVVQWGRKGRARGDGDVKLEGIGTTTTSDRGTAA